MSARVFAVLAALSFAINAAPAVAEDHDMPLSVESVQDTVIKYFGLGRATIRNWNDENHGSWDMVRKVDSATTIRRCFTQLQVPTIVSKTNSNPVATFGIDWKDMGTVTVTGSTFKFHAAWMGANEYASITVESADRADQLQAAFEYLRDNCKA